MAWSGYRWLRMVIRTVLKAVLVVTCHDLVARVVGFRRVGVMDREVILDRCASCFFPYQGDAGCFTL